DHAVGALLQPAVHDIVGNGDGNETGNDNQLQEILGQHVPNIDNGGRHYFSDPYFLATLFGDEGGEAKETHTADQDGKAAKTPRQGSYPFLGRKFFTVFLVHKIVLEGDVGEMLLKDPFDQGQALACTLVGVRSEEHTSELQSRENLVCRLLLEKKKLACASHHA